MIVRESRCIGCGACVDACPEDAITWADGPVTDWNRCERCGICADACFADAREQIGREMTVAQVLAEIERDVAFYDESGGGVTLTGGEPLAQHAFTLALLAACKAREIHTALDTCGFASWNVLDQVRPYVDLFLYDLKLVDDARHREVTGAPVGPILANLRALSERGHAIRLRVPVIPGVNDDDESIRQIAAFAASLPHLQGIDLLPYHTTAADKYARMNKPYRLGGTHPPSEVTDGGDWGDSARGWTGSQRPIKRRDHWGDGRLGAKPLQLLSHQEEDSIPSNTHENWRNLMPRC